MKNILSEITEQEKNRILEMHKKSTSRFYLSEQSPNYKSIYTALKDAQEMDKNILVYLYSGSVDQNVINSMTIKSREEKNPPIVAATNNDDIINQVETSPVTRKDGNPFTLPAVFEISVSQNSQINNVVLNRTTEFISAPTNKPIAQN